MSSSTDNIPVDSMATPSTAIPTTTTTTPISSNNNNVSQRQDLISSAVRFLNDPKVSSYSLAKKISFLESKGLTANEIQSAIAQSGQPSNVVASNAPYASPYATPYTSPYSYPPPPAPLGWRDYTLMASMVAATGYGLWHLIKKYIPFPNHSEIEQSQSQLVSSLTDVTTTLDIVKRETQDVATVISTYGDKVKEMVDKVENQVNELRSDLERDVKGIKEEVESIRDDLPKLLDKHASTQTALIQDLQSEIKSLKSLLVNRRFGSSVTQSPSSLSNPSSTLVNGEEEKKPSIPSWQLEADGGTSGSANGESDF